MSILVLMDRFLPDAGGSINWMVNTYSRWSADEVIFVVPQCENSKSVDTSLPFKVIRVPMSFENWDPMRPKSFFSYVSLAVQVQKICRQYYVQQIHCAKVLPEGLVGCWIHGIKGIPYISYVHGEEILFTQTSRTFSWLAPKVYNRASALISNSSNTKFLLTRIGVAPHHIHVIHPAVDATIFVEESEKPDWVREQYDLENSKVLLTVGRLQRRKGQDMVIRALAKVHEQMPCVKYVIVGEGEDFSYFKHLAEEVGVDECVVFAGRVGVRELPAFYAASDIFVMPNRQIGGDIEGFGMVFLEASAAGKPVIGGKSGGTNEAILEGITGHRVNGEKADDIAETILHLLSRPDEARRMGTAGRKWVCQERSWDVVVQRTHHVVASIHG